MHLKILKYKWVALVLFLSFLVLYPTIFNDFLNWDDTKHLFGNHTVRQLSVRNIAEMFLSTVNTTYIPVTIFSYALEYKLAQYNPVIYHLDNLVLHLIVVLLVYQLSIKMSLSQRAAGIACVIFAIHPMHVESYAWVTARKDVLYSIFYLLAMLSYVQYLNTSARKYFIVTVIMGFLSMLSKPMALTLPLILLLIDWFQGRYDIRKALVEKIPFFVYIIPLVLITYSLNTHMFTIETSLWQSFLIFVWTLTFYLIKFFVPLEYIPIYPMPEPISIFNISYTISMAVFVLTAILLFVYRKNKWWIFGFVFYLSSIFCLLRYGKINEIMVADRYMYLPSLGFCLFLGVAIDQLLVKCSTVKRNILSIILICLCASLAYQSRMLIHVWHDNLTFWNYIILKSPNEAIAYTNRCSEYAQQKQYEQALADCQKAIELAPDKVEGMINRGIIYLNTKRYQEALADFNEAVLREPEFENARYNRGNLYYYTKKYDLALKDYAQALRLNPNYSAAYLNRGIIYLNQKKYKQAYSDLNNAIRLDPNEPKAYYSRGVIYLNHKKMNEALKDFNQAIKLDPQFAKAYQNRGVLRYRQGQYQQALNDMTKALEYKPDFAFAYLNRSFIQRALGNNEQAFIDASTAKSLGQKVDKAYLDSLKGGIL